METYGSIGIIDKLFVSVKNMFRRRYIPVNVSVLLAKELKKEGLTK